MALKILQPGIQPLGQYDGLDTEVLTLKGGEVVSFTSVEVPGTDKAAYDSMYDGYVNPGGVQKRPVISRTLFQSSRPLMLADEGITGYGTMFGSIISGTIGQQVTGTVIGPHTAAASGKVTCWDKPGLYAVTLDACDTDPTDGLQPTNTALDTGAPLYATPNGILTPDASQSFAADFVVARFIEFATNGSLVTTPNYLASAYGSASTPKQFSWATFWFNPSIT